MPGEAPFFPVLSAPAKVSLGRCTPEMNSSGKGKVMILGVRRTSFRPLSSQGFLCPMEAETHMTPLSKKGRMLKGSGLTGPLPPCLAGQRYPAFRTMPENLKSKSGSQWWSLPPWQLRALQSLECQCPQHAGNAQSPLPGEGWVGSQPRGQQDPLSSQPSRRNLGAVEVSEAGCSSACFPS